MPNPLLLIIVSFAFSCMHSASDLIRKPLNCSNVKCYWQEQMPLPEPSFSHIEAVSTTEMYGIHNILCTFCKSLLVKNPLSTNTSLEVPPIGATQSYLQLNTRSSLQVKHSNPESILKTNKASNYSSCQSIFDTVDFEKYHSIKGLLNMS